MCRASVSGTEPKSRGKDLQPIEFMIAILYRYPQRIPALAHAFWLEPVHRHHTTASNVSRLRHSYCALAQATSNLA
jgi:hypothetical protein